MNDSPRELPLLKTLYQQWKAARGHRTMPSKQAYSRDWEKLLTTAGIIKDPDRKDAVYDARELVKLGLIEIIPQKFHSDRIERIRILLEAEPRLRELFGDSNASDLHAAASEILCCFRDRVHPLHPEIWRAWCERLVNRLGTHQPIPPLDWRKPDSIQEALEALFALTSRDWPPFTPIRTASVTLGFESKWLEQQQTRMESLVHSLFAGEIDSLADLGIVGNTPLLLISGPLVFEFEDGSRADFTALHSYYALNEIDLKRMKSVGTSALRILTVENSKTTFPQLAAANRDGETLIVASSFATPAISRLLHHLPRTLPHFHFGDTDPYGFAILHSLRKASPDAANVRPFLMCYRPQAESTPLDAKARHLAETLLGEEAMADCHDELRAMLQAETKGDYEQESYGPPVLQCWPFFPEAIMELQ